MKYLLTGQQMKAWDTNTIECFGMPALVLMERAALKVVECMRTENYDLSNVLVVCGTGNNGGDGIAIARLLHLAGHKVTLVFPGDEEKVTPQTKQQLEIARNYSMDVNTNIPKEAYTVIVDALFGIGLTRPITGLYYSVIEDIMNLKERSKATRIVAVDIPSGIHSDTASVMGTAIKADLTVTFGAMKLGQLLYPGADYCGKCVVADIGITKESLPEANYGFTYEYSDLKYLPKRCAYGNKGTFGKVLVIAGNKDMCGAAYLASMSAFRSGAGMVRIFTEESNREALQTLIPEAILTTYKRGEHISDSLASCLDWANVVVFGPGFGTDVFQENLYQEVVMQLNEKQLPCVMDADALNIYSKQSEKNFAFPVIMTPHLGEMSRMCKKSVGQIKENLIQTAVEFAKAFRVILVLKDARSVVAWGDDSFFVNSGGNNGMATAGSGDVLSGCIAALIGQGLNLSQSARMGVFLHGLGGDLAAKERGKAALMAGDILNGIESVRKTYEEV